MALPSPSKIIKFSSSNLVATAAVAVISEPYILANVIRFIPTTQSTNSTSEQEIVLHSIATLCKAIPAIGRLLGPTNEHFWRSMVLNHFDFAVDTSRTFNQFDYESYLSMKTLEYMQYEVVGPNGSNKGGLHVWNPEGENIWDRHPVKPFVDAWNAAHPEQRYPSLMLNHDLHYWSTLRAYYRPSEFQFLTDIQAGMANLEEAWPVHEDAFTLFRDLILLQKLVQPEDKPFETFSDGNAYVYPLLMSRFNGRIHGNGYELLEFCDFLPHYWCSHRRVSARWTGFDFTPDPSKHPGKKGYVGGNRTEEEDDVFPRGENRQFKRLRWRVYESFVDWRRVDANFGEYQSPIFHIGESKGSGRWLGYVGSRQYEPRTSTDFDLSKYNQHLMHQRYQRLHGGTVGTS